MIPSVGLKVHKEEHKKELKKISIVRRGNMPFSDSESSSNSDNEGGGNSDALKRNEEKNKPKRVIQKSSVIERHDDESHDKDRAGDNNSKTVLSKRALIRNKLLQKELSSAVPESEVNKPNELLSYIHNDNDNANASFNTAIKEDVIDIKSFTAPTIQYNNPASHQSVYKQAKPVIEYESQREKELMEKYVINHSDSSSSDNDQPQMLSRPLFIPSKSSKPLPQIESELDKEASKAIKQKQLTTSLIVQSYLQKDLQSAQLLADDNSPALPDDTDLPDDLNEYEQWKIRELKRIKRQIEENEVKIKSKIEIERRSHLTNEQREDENIKLGSDATLRNFKSKINYLQKYYHKGAFFQDEAKEKQEHIYNRDFNLPTWEDKVDRSAMPEIMAKRRGKLFKKGQTKYTHLTNEDTTNFDLAFKVPENISKNLQAKSAGFKSMNKFGNK